ncbi:MAG: DUF1080 domain-containing protein, partial [Planctomycetes bacterium]|nr:DUF1080 domain-containing protein [Planctomycetota bacterium]
MTRLFSLLTCLVFLLIGCGTKSTPTSNGTSPATDDSSGADLSQPEAQTNAPNLESSNADSSPSGPALEEKTADGTNWLSRDELEEGWVRLFDGHTLFGWEASSDANWKVNDGVIWADSGTAGLLCTTCQFSDYELRCDYRVAQGGNSGIFLRTPMIPKNPAVDCYELNMCDSHPEYKTGSFVGRAKPEPAVEGDGTWHSYHVVAQGPKVTVKFDGKVVLEYTDTTSAPLTIGHIGLQYREGKIEFRNVYLKPLSTEPLFDGTSLTGWREVPGGKSRFSVVDETIHVESGRGFLETEKVAGDFLLQFEAK